MNIVSLSITVTNGMGGLFATLVNQGLKRTLHIGAIAMALVVLLSGMQQMVFPSAKLSFSETTTETKYVLREEAGGPTRIFSSLLFHSMVMPDIIMLDTKNSLLETGTVAVELGKKMSIQRSQLGSGTVWAPIAVVLWCFLLGLGIWALLRVTEQARFRLVLGLMLCGQVVLHLLYGEETFLYAIHVVPFLILTVGMATLTAVRPMVLGLVAILIILMGANNVHQFKQAIDRQNTLTRPYQPAR